MQIHELSRRRRADEGFMDIARGLGDAAGVTKGQAASAGILDPAKKLAAVRNNSDMKRVAAQLAKGWTDQAKAPAKTAAPTTPIDERDGAYDKKTGAATLDGKRMTALSDLPPAIQQQIQAKQQAAVAPAATTPAPAATTPPKSGMPLGFNAANVMKMPGMPGMPGQPTVPGATKPPAATPAVPAAQPWTPANTNVKPGGSAEAQAFKAQQAAAKAPAAAPAPTAAPEPTAPAPAPAAPPKNTATAEYLKKFLAYVNQKTAIRDSTTYQMIGLNQILYQSGLRAELDKAKAEVLKAYEAGQDVTAAATDYILTAMAGAQLVMSKNKAGVNQQSPDPVTVPDATTGDAPPGTTAAVPGAASGFLSKEDVQGLFKQNGVDIAVLTKLGTALQQASGTNTVNRTGNNTIDNMIRALGFKVK